MVDTKDAYATDYGEPAPPAYSIQYPASTPYPAAQQGPYPQAGTGPGYPSTGQTPYPDGPPQYDQGAYYEPSALDQDPEANQQQGGRGGRGGRRGKKNKYQPTEADGFTSIADASMQAAFLRKVYGLLFLQLAVTTGIVCLFAFNDKIRNYIQSGNAGSQALLWSSFISFLVLYITLLCCGSVRRKHPINLILLFLFTISFSYIIGVTSSFYTPTSIVVALGITCFVAFATSLFACQTKLPFTPIIIAVFVLSITMMGFAITMIFCYSNVLIAIYGAIGALLFSLFLLLDTYMILHGSKHGELFMEEYVFAVIILYIDIVYIFMFILMCLGGSTRN